ncbi:hypothetical protein [Limosilactobacillus caecicola]|uniref:hypothetical protein n=1 Tax=Limosilactobacillus caecicola TaxID=2941332 RepID=UPI00203CCA9B|nr:hypothetical protein [Limosilactobacillus caecicola]
MALSIILLGLFCGVICYYQRYLARQELINDQLTEQWLAESMVKLAGGNNQRFNLGNVKKVNINEWIVTMNSGTKVRVVK